MGRCIAIGGIWHETNTFAAGPTRLKDFESYQLARGSEILSRYTGTNTELGGVIAAADDCDFELLPTLYAGAVPSATIAKEVMQQLCDELIERIPARGSIDGAVLTMHGAAVGEGFPDADAYVLGRVRQHLGPDVPVVATYDFHANLSDEMVASADVVIGYDSFPHVDMAERGSEAAQVLNRILRTGKRPARALRRIPLLTVPQKQATTEAPAKDLIGQLHAIESRDRVWCGSLALGFPYCDVSHLGASVVMFADDEHLAASAADEVAKAVWDRRAEFSVALTDVDAAVREAIRTRDYPVVLVEPADNIGGGSAGDCAVILEALLRLGADDAVIVIADPEAVRLADAVGVGGDFDGLVGGKTDDLHGPPVRAEGKVEYLRDTSFTHKGSYMTGFVTSMGRTAIVNTGGVRIVLTSLRTMPFDTEQLRCVDIEPAAQRIIVVKSAMAWRAAYGEFARTVIFLDTPGVCASNLEHFRYAERPSPLYPLEPDTTYNP